MNKKKAVILGHTGFIGKNLFSNLENKSIYSDLRGFSLPEVDLSDSRNISFLENYFDGYTDMIFLAGIKPNVKNNIDSLLENIQMVTNIAKLIMKKNIGKVLYFSSAAVYGEDVENLSISEDTNINLRSYYAIAKYTSENILKKAMLEISNDNLIIIRPATIYGSPDDKKIYNPSGMLLRALSNEPITLWGDGEEKREFLYIGDVVKITSDLIQNAYTGVINISSGVSYTFADVVETIGKILNKKINVVSRARTKNKVDNVYNNSRLCSILPYIRFTPLEEGLKKILYEKKKE